MLERFRAKWTPVRVKKTRQIKNLELRFDSIETEKALASPVAGRRPCRCIANDERFRKGPAVTLRRLVAAIIVTVVSATAAQADPIVHRSAVAAPAASALEDRYIASRDAAIKKLSPIYDAGKFDDAAKKAEDAVVADLTAQMTAILGEPRRPGYGPPKLNADTFYKGDEGFGALDGLRFDSELGTSGQKAGSNDADGKYVEPKSHIIVTTQRLFGRWLHDHKEWWGKGITNVPQGIAAALKAESFYTQSISSGSAVINFGALPIAKPASASFACAMLAGQTQSEIPDAADEIFVSALADGKVFIGYGAIQPEVRISACLAIRDGTNKRAAEADEKFQRKEIDKKAYDRLGDLRQQSEDAYKRCFTERAPQQPSFAQATKQAEALLAAAMGK